MISMQGPTTTPTEDGEASIPMEHALNSPNLNPTFTVHRKAAKRILPWDLPVDEIQLALPRPQDEDEGPRETKRPRLEEPVHTPTDEAATKTTSHDTTVAHPPDAAPAAADHHADSDPARTTGACHRWASEEDAWLTTAVMNTRKKKWGKEFKMDWVAISALVPERSKFQCKHRWCSTLGPNIDQTPVCTAKWVEDEDIKLKDAVRKHGGKDWIAIAALVPGRTKFQCRNRWHNALDPSIDWVKECTGKWKEDEVIKLKDAVRKHGGKNWVAIAALVPGRTQMQCQNRWHNASDPSIERVKGCTGKWKEDEVIKLKYAVQTHGDKNWAAITALVPGRTKQQCYDRWKKSGS